MIINEIPLQNLKDILATDTPLAIETTEAVIERLETAGRRLDAMRRQRDGFMNEARRNQKALEQAEAQVARVREQRDKWDDAGYRHWIVAPAAVIALDYALDGEPNE